MYPFLMNLYCVFAFFGGCLLDTISPLPRHGATKRISFVRDEGQGADLYTVGSTQARRIYVIYTLNTGL